MPSLRARSNMGLGLAAVRVLRLQKPSAPICCCYSSRVWSLSCRCRRWFPILAKLNTKLIVRTPKIQTARRWGTAAVDRMHS